jgi:NADH oxidase (H2O2-forming)
VGIESKNVFTFHTVADANGILDYVKQNQVKRVIVCGAGLSGLEAADALSKHGLNITLIEKNNRVLSTLLNEESAAFLHKQIAQAGVTLRCNTQMSQFALQDDQITAVQLTDGAILETDLVIVATGLQANTDLAKKAGIIVNNNGVVVNEFMQTNLPHIYAGGDLIEVKDQLTGITTRSCMWPDAMQQGMLAASAMLGKPRAYAGPSLIISSAFFGLKFAHAGILSPSEGVFQRQGEDYCHRYLLENGILRGFQVLGNRHNLGNLRRILLIKQPVSIHDLQVNPD